MSTGLQKIGARDKILAESAAGFTLSLLGAFSIADPRGQIISIKSKKNRALLAILALSPSHTMTRERLADLLWGEHGEEQARNSLRQSLAVLRKELGPYGSELIRSGDETLSLARERVTVDALTILHAEQDSDLKLLKQAAASCRGELLSEIGIHGEAFGSWLTGERRRLADLAVSVHERLCANSTGADRVTVARRLLALDPLRESAHRALMEALAAIGERDQALRQYDACREMLARELDVKPAGETEQLRASILSGEKRVLTAPPVSQSDAVELRDEPTIAVLPFASLSLDPKHEFFAEGMTDSIISTLSKVPYVRVIARSSTQIYKGRPVDVRDVGREQGVRYVLEGTVKAAGDHLRITATLIDCETGLHIWSQKHDGTLTDIFALQDEIAFRVALAVNVELLEGDQALIRAGGPRNLEAWELTIQASKLTSHHDRSVFPAARRALHRAIALDPGHAHAWTSLAWTHWLEAFCGWSQDSKVSIDAASAAATKAHEISPANPEPFLVLAMAQLQRRDFDGAEQHMATARKLGPNHAMVPAIGANVSMFAGRPEEALRQSRLAMKLCPIYPPWYAGDVAQANLQLGRLHDAIEWSHAAIKRGAGFIHAYLFLIVAYHEQGKPAEALAAAEAALKVDPMFSANAWVDAQPFEDRQMNQRFLAALEAAGIPN